FAEIRAEIRKHLHIRQSLCCAVFRLCKRKIFGNTKHHRVVERGSLLVKFSNRRGAYSGVDARENIQDYLLSLVVAQTFFRKIRSYQCKVLGLVTNRGKASPCVYAISFECYFCHNFIVFWFMFISNIMDYQAHYNKPSL